MSIFGHKFLYLQSFGGRNQKLLRDKKTLLIQNKLEYVRLEKEKVKVVKNRRHCFIALLPNNAIMETVFDLPKSQKIGSYCPVGLSP